MDTDNKQITPCYEFQKNPKWQATVQALIALGQFKATVGQPKYPHYFKSVEKYLMRLQDNYQKAGMEIIYEDGSKQLTLDLSEEES